MIRIRSQLPKYFSIQILITLLFSLQVIACSNEDLARTIADDVTTESSENSDSSIHTDVNLSWTAPSQRENNEPISLSEIAGYKVYYGTEARHYPQSVNIEDSSATGYTFRNLSAGTYHFALTTYDTAGRESQYSSEIVIII
jgi:hypothetical protein